MANVSKLLFTTTAPEYFLDNLQLEPNDHLRLKDARRKVRLHLKAVFAVASMERFGAAISPRFFTQGSYAYKTINAPAWTPPQQMDMDDGCYLPMSFVKGERPSKAAEAFFEVVDAALQELAATEGWEFASKPTCARLVLGADAHIDVPLYAIPDGEFRRLEEAKMLKRADSAALQASDSKDRWDALPSDCVLLAHREKDWVASDPRKIHDWFTGAVGQYGEQLRRVSRYLKAWRDHHHPDLDRLSSIILMVCAWQAFEEIGGRNVPARDDQALLKVVERLPGYLAGEIENPTDRTEKLDKRLGDADRRTAILKAGEMLTGLVAVEKEADAVAAVRSMQTLFGERVPDRPDLVSIAEAAATVVRSHPPKTVAAPTVGRSQSG